MSKDTRQTIHLGDYTPPAFLVDSVDLHFELDRESTRVRSRLSVARNPAAPPGERTLLLDGEALELVSVALDGEVLGANRYTADDGQLRISEVPNRFELEIETRIHPGANTALEGLYTSGGNFCTQCEAEGFRRITYFPDRPDVMSRYTTTIVADRGRCPVLLSNGNPVARGELDGGRHWVRWEDPFRKPSYLFALVAGDLACIEDTFVTRSGREVALRLYVERHNADKCDHAMASLKKAMRWDEERFGLEYDLDIYMIVAVDDFNMGAMENKGLNVFNSKYVLANPATATDSDYAHIEGVIAHEYFHNWTGNRVTLRDWFQLSLKEGLTVFRDQEFSSDVQSRPVKRIQDVRLLRTAQFAEDAGPMAHPVRPDSYIEISNFYTVTVYEKGAEVIRMIHTLLGREGFRKGMDLYFQRHDGQAVTTDDFVRAMEDATGTDLQQFRRWYSQAGTPVVHASGSYDPQARTYTLDVRQSCPPTPGQSHKEPFHVPLAVGLLDEGGREVPLRLEGERGAGGATTRVLDVRREHQRFRFLDVDAPPVPSLLRGFSAPVKLELERPDAELAFLFAHDPEPFNRWDAGQELATRLLFRLVDDVRAGRTPALDGAFEDAVRNTLGDAELDRALVAEALTLPSESWLAERMEVIDVEAIHAARRFLRAALGRALREDWLRTYRATEDTGEYGFDAHSAGRRSLRNLCLAYLVSVEEDGEVRALGLRQFRGADNMTDALAALAVLANTDCAERTEVLAEFYRRWKDDPLVLDKWFAIQATSRLPGTLDEVKALMEHPSFRIRNPNRVRALIGAFCHGNQVRFHAAGGEGYRFLADRVLQIDPMNPQVAARLVGAFSRWRRFDEGRKALMKAELQRILAAPKLSRDSYEIASKTLG